MIYESKILSHTNNKNGSAIVQCLKEQRRVQYSEYYDTNAHTCRIESCLHMEVLSASSPSAACTANAMA